MPLFKNKKRTAAKEAAAADEKMAGIMSKREARKAATTTTTTSSAHHPQSSLVSTSATSVLLPQAAADSGLPGTGNLAGCPLESSDYELAWTEGNSRLYELPRSRLVSSFTQAMADKASLNAYARYAARQGAMPHLKFWRAVEQLRRAAHRLPDAERITRTRMLYETTLLSATASPLGLSEESDAAAAAERGECPSDSNPTDKQQQQHQQQQQQQQQQQKQQATQPLPQLPADVARAGHEAFDEHGPRTLACLEPAARFCLEVLQTRIWPPYARGPAHNAQQHAVLTARDLCLADVLLSDEARMSLMSYLEREAVGTSGSWTSGDGREGVGGGGGGGGGGGTGGTGGAGGEGGHHHHAPAALLHFWLMATNFSTNARRGQLSADEATEDAMGIYNRFFSLNATDPLGVDEGTRRAVESNICAEEGGVGADCFLRAQHLVLTALRLHHFPHFCRSQAFNAYVAGVAKSAKSADIDAGFLKGSSSGSGGGGGGSGDGSVASIDATLADEEEEALLEEVSRDRGSLGTVNEWGVYLRDIEVANDPVFQNAGGKQKGKRASKKQKAERDAALATTKRIIEDIHAEMRQHRTLYWEQDEANNGSASSGASAGGAGGRASGTSRLTRSASAGTVVEGGQGGGGGDKNGTVLHHRRHSRNHSVPHKISNP